MQKSMNLVEPHDMVSTNKRTHPNHPDYPIVEYQDDYRLVVPVEE